MKNKLLAAGLDGGTTRDALTTAPQEPDNDFVKVKALASTLKAKGLDITATYDNWLKTGFALANAFGEEGRELFHELSSLYPTYNREEADKQYDNCLRTQHGEVNLATLFFLAQTQGLAPAFQAETIQTPTKPSPSACPTPTPTPSQPPTFSDKIDSNKLPTLLQAVAQKAISPADCDMLLLGAITCLSSCLPNISGIYGGRVVWANLFLFVSAHAAAGKGRLNLCRQIIQPIHKAKRDAFNAEMKAYKQAQAAYVINKKDGQYEEPEAPKMQMHFVPANSSSTIMYQALNDNDGIGMLFETEGDTLTTTFGTDHGNYSDGLRKAFHHESISYMRRKDKEYVEMTSPKFSVLLSGTPKQVVGLIPSSENGLFSRFIFYQLPTSAEWLDPFIYSGEEDLDHYFIRLGLDFYETYKMLQLMPDMHFKLSPAQGRQFNAFFELVQGKCYGMFGDDIIGSVRRLGLITFRIAMVLTALRITGQNGFQRTITCSDDDFDTAMCISQQLISHTVEMFQQIQGQQPSTMLKKRETVKVEMKNMLLERLPQQFDRATYQQTGCQLGVSSRTIDRYMNEMISCGWVEKLQHDQYRKTHG